jgi:hypothetical protein
VGSLTGAVALILKSFSVKDFNGAFLGKPKKQIGYMLEPLVKTCGPRPFDFFKKIKRAGGNSQARL